MPYYTYYRDVNGLCVGPQAQFIQAVAARGCLGLLRDVLTSLEPGSHLDLRRNIAGFADRAAEWTRDAAVIDDLRALQTLSQ